MNSLGKCLSTIVFNVFGMRNGIHGCSSLLDNSSTVTQAAKGAFGGSSTTPVSSISAHIMPINGTNSGSNQLLATVTKVDNVWGPCTSYTNCGSVTFKADNPKDVQNKKEAYDERDRLFGELMNTMIDQGVAPNDWIQDEGMNFDLTNFTCIYTKNTGTGRINVEESIVGKLSGNKSFYQAFDALRQHTIELKDGLRCADTVAALSKMSAKNAARGNRTPLPLREAYKKDLMKAGSTDKMRYSSAYSEIPETFERCKAVFSKKCADSTTRIDRMKTVYDALTTTLGDRKTALVAPNADLAQITMFEEKLKNADQFALSAALAYYQNKEGEERKKAAEELISDLKEFSEGSVRAMQQEIKDKSGLKEYTDEGTILGNLQNAGTCVGNFGRSMINGARDIVSPRPHYVQPIDEGYPAESARLLFSGVDNPSSPDASFYHKFCNDHQITNPQERYIEDDLMQIVVGDSDAVVDSWGLDSDTTKAVKNALNFSALSAP